MKFKEFYASVPECNMLSNMDRDYQRNLNALTDQIRRGAWTEKQKKVQIKSILSNIALYRTFLQYGISKERALELVQLRAFAKAKKIHKVLAKGFRIPKFSKAFRLFMRKGMSGDEIWHSDLLRDDDHGFAIDVTKCLWNDTCTYFGCPELCQVFCDSDFIVFGDIQKMDFCRSKTLGKAGDRCDFHFKFKE